MNVEEIRKYLDNVMKELFETMVPKYINGHELYGGYGVNIVSENYINLDFGIGFEPNTGRSDIKHYFGYAEGIPTHGFDIEANRKLFETRIRNDLGMRILDLCEAINKDDRENPIPYSIRRGKSNLVVWRGEDDAKCQ